MAWSCKPNGKACDSPDCATMDANGKKKTGQTKRKLEKIFGERDEAEWSDVGEHQAAGSRPTTI